MKRSIQKLLQWYVEAHADLREHLEGIFVPDIYAALIRLQTPIHYKLDQNGDQLTLLLSDNQLGVQAVRSVTLQEYQIRISFASVYCMPSMSCEPKVL